MGLQPLEQRGEVAGRYWLVGAEVAIRIQAHPASRENALNLLTVGATRVIVAILAWRHALIRERFCRNPDGQGIACQAAVDPFGSTQRQRFPFGSLPADRLCSAQKQAPVRTSRLLNSICICSPLTTTRPTSGHFAGGNGALSVSDSPVSPVSRRRCFLKHRAHYAPGRKPAIERRD